MQRRGFLALASASAATAALGRASRAHAQPFPPPMCPTVVTHEVYRTPEGARIPTDGGVLVSLTFDYTQGPEAPATYTIEHAGRERAATVTAIAPGIGRIRTAGLTGPIIVRGPAGTRHVEAVAERGALPTAPHVVGVRMRPLTGQFDVPGGATAHVSVQAPIPEGVVAMLAYLEPAPRPQPVRPIPLCFALVRPGERDVALWQPRTHCDGSIPGEGTIYADLTLRTAYVDSVGRVSNQSNHVVVRG